MGATQFHKNSSLSFLCRAFDDHARLFSFFSFFLFFFLLNSPPFIFFFFSFFLFSSTFRSNTMDVVYMPACGGFAPINIGDQLDNRYGVIRKLSVGRTSVTWLAVDDV